MYCEGRVSRTDALLDAWAERDAWAKRTTVRQYSLLESDVETVARKLVKVYPAGETLVFTQWFAANLRHPYAVPLQTVGLPTLSAPNDERIEPAPGGISWGQAVTLLPAEAREFNGPVPRDRQQRVAVFVGA